MSSVKKEQGVALFQGRKVSKSQMIKNIAVILVSYNGEWDKEVIFKVTEIQNIEQLKEFKKRAEDLDKKNGIKSRYRLEIFTQ